MESSTFYTRFLIFGIKSSPLRLVLFQITAWEVGSEDEEEQRREIHWLTQDTVEFSLPGLGPVLANAGQRGYFRVNYEAGNWRALTDLLAQSGGGAEAVDAASRAQLYDDAFNLARAGIISYDVGFVPNT